MKENFKASRLRKHLVGYYYNLQNFALDRGFLPGNKNYCKFVIVSRGRTGSTLLRTSLATHHQIKMFGEFFRIPDRIIWHPNFGHETDRAHKLASTDPANFFDNRVFRTYPQNIKAAGFKIFYYHAEEGNFKQVWKYLVEQKDMRIIHNKRRNILKTQLSDKRAWQTGQWAVKNKNIESNQKNSIHPLKLDYDELLLWFNLTRKWENDTDTIFANHPKIDVYYEDLAQDYKVELNRIQEFLELDLEVICPTTQKPARGTLSEQISNYADLKAEFKGTPWSDFFEE